MKQKKKISFSFIHMGAPSLLMIFLVLLPVYLCTAFTIQREK